MSIQSKARSVLQSIAKITAASTVTVISQGQTVTAIRNTQNNDTAADIYGEQGSTSAFLHIDSSLMTKPGRGSTILIDGDAAIVTQVTEDAANAMWRIEYQDQKEVEGI